MYLIKIRTIHHEATFNWEDSHIRQGSNFVASSVDRFAGIEIEEYESWLEENNIEYSYVGCGIGSRCHCYLILFEKTNIVAFKLRFV